MAGTAVVRHPDPAQRIASRGALAALLLALVAVMVVATGGPARAHVGVARTSPGDGERVEQRLSGVSLVLEQPVDLQLSAIVIIGPDGRNWAKGPLRESGTLLSQELSAAAPAGGYRAAYRVVAADGHVVTGSVRFTTVAGGPARRPADAAGAADTPRHSGSWGALRWVAGGSFIVLLGVVRRTAARRVPGPQPEHAAGTRA